jgi:hypothetical protein
MMEITAAVNVEAASVNDRLISTDSCKTPERLIGSCHTPVVQGAAIKVNEIK